MIGKKTWFRDVSIRKRQDQTHTGQQQNSSLVDRALILF